VAGLGSTNVVNNLLLSLSTNKHLESKIIKIYLPDIEYWRTNSTYNPNWEITFIKRSNNKLIRLFNRFYEVLFSNFFISKSNTLVILGDFPIRSRSNQILLLHNPHLVKPLYIFDQFIFHRILFKLNHKFVNKCIVQTDLMKDSLISNYPHFVNNTFALLMPVNNSFANINNIEYHEKKLNLFYPASFYKHKNHAIINKVVTSKNFHKIESVKFILTITEQDWFKISHLNYNTNKEIKFVGTLKHDEVVNYYTNSGILFFPSLDETFGLPLVEAMKMGLFILCSNLPYAKLLCGDEAIYFDPNNENSIINAIEELQFRINNKIYPNWDNPLIKFPENWNIYSEKFIQTIYNEN